MSTPMGGGGGSGSPIGATFNSFTNKNSLHMPTAAFLPVALVFVISGSICTIGNKWADMLHAPDNDGNMHSYEHPFVQSLMMFTGEWLCMLPYQISLYKKVVSGDPVVEGEDVPFHGFKPWYLLFPAMCDFIASTMMFVGLTYTYASVYQMLKGGTALFTAIFSRIFLKRIFQRYEILGLVFVVGGLATVGVGATVETKGGSAGAPNPVLGNSLIFAAQVIASIQFTYEERLIHKYRIPPFLVVGWEGFFGWTASLVALCIFQATDGKPDDIVLWAQQMARCGTCLMATMLNFVGVPLYNASAVTITRGRSAAARMVLDTIRNVVVWVVGLTIPFFGEKFLWLQLVGFAVLVTGTMTYKHVLKIPHPFFKRVEPDAAFSEEDADGEEPERRPTELEAIAGSPQTPTGKTPSYT